LMKYFNKKSPLLWLIIILVLIGLFTRLGPPEQTLGVNVRVVYLHGAWVWIALVAFVLSGGIGLVGLLTQKTKYHRWSRALGRTGLFFWITYLPISLWAMETNWNGLFLAEPRWRIAVVFAVGGFLLQAGLSLLENPIWSSGMNLAFVAGLLLALSKAEQVMHPPSPIFSSDSSRIQIYFIILTAMVSLAAWQVARWWYQFERA